MSERNASSEASTGLLVSLKQMVATLLALGETRLQLFSTELEEELARISSLLLLACVGLFFLGLGVIFAAFFIVIIYWDSNRLLAVGLLAAFFIIAAALTAAALGKQLRARPPFFAASIDELRKDHQHLGKQQ